MAQIFADDYSGVPAGNVSLTSAWTAKGYSELENSGTPSNVAVLARASFPSGLTSDLRFPSAAGKQVVKFTLAATDVEARLLWSGFPAGVRVVSVSWWEYRDAGNLGGEKFCRVGNFVSGPGSNRGVDSIITLGQVSATTLIANSANMHDYGDHSLSPGLSGSPSFRGRLHPLYRHQCRWIGLAVSKRPARWTGEWAAVFQFRFGHWDSTLGSRRLELDGRWHGRDGHLSDRPILLRSSHCLDPAGCLGDVWRFTHGSRAPVST